MRILIDECIPRKLKRHLSGHECQTVPESGLAGKDNGELLSLAEQRKFDGFQPLIGDLSTSRTLLDAGSQ